MAVELLSLDLQYLVIVDVKYKATGVKFSLHKMLMVFHDEICWED